MMRIKKFEEIKFAENQVLSVDMKHMVYVTHIIEYPDSEILLVKGKLCEVQGESDDGKHLVSKIEDGYIIFDFYKHFVYFWDMDKIIFKVNVKPDYKGKEISSKCIHNRIRFHLNNLCWCKFCDKCGTEFRCNSHVCLRAREKMNE